MNQSDETMLVDVSVVLACYTEKRLENIRAALVSLRKQTLEPRQVIVAVDNNAALGTLLSREFDWATVVENSGGRGASYARNRGVEEVNSEFTAFLDDDEIADPDWLLELTKPFGDEQVVGTGGAYEPAWETVRPTWFPDEFAWVVGGAYTGLPTETAPIRNVWSGNMCVRTAMFREVGGFRTDFGKQGTASQPEDTDLCIRMATESGRHWMYVPSAVILHEVPRDRASFAFFIRRCFSEGAGKAAMRAKLDGSVVSTEHDYVRRTAISGLRQIATMTSAGAVHGVVILLGLASAAMGYAVGTSRPLMAKACRW